MSSEKQINTKFPKNVSRILLTWFSIRPKLIYEKVQKFKNSFLVNVNFGCLFIT
jgi:hypothetical protein